MGNFNIEFSDFEDVSNPGIYALPSREVFIALPSFSKISLKVTPLLENKIQGIPRINRLAKLKNDSSLTYQSVPLNFVKINSMPPLFEIKGYLWIRNYYCVDIKINQYRYNNTDIISELKKAGIEITIATPQNSKMFPGITNGNIFEEQLPRIILNYPDAVQLDKRYYDTLKISTEYSWINFNNTYIKVGVATDGIYRINKSDLDNLGVSTGQIDPRTIKLLTRGQEQSVYVYGEDDGSFDSGDYIEFFGKRNWGDNYRQTSAQNESYKEYLNRYTDTTTYWLTWNDGLGKRIDTLTSSSAATDTLQYYNEVVHYEQNRYLDYSIPSIIDRQDPYWLQNETWVWGQQGVGTVNRTFTVQDVYPNVTAHAFYKVQDFASNGFTGAHKVGLSINNDATVYDSASFDKYQQRVVKADFSSNLLNEGNNILKTISFPTNATLNSIEYDWYEVEYPRFIKAENDSLNFRFVDLSVPFYRTIKISNILANDIIIYKLTGTPKKITNYTRSGSIIYFNDTVSAGDQYYLISAAKIHSPKYFYVKKITDLTNSSNQADYILITAPEFLSKAQEYTSFIQSNYNVTTKLINVNDIYDQFNYGFFAPEPIRDFLEAANLNWQSPKPSYLFIVGDANYDYYGNKSIYFGSPPVKNYVPSFGDPVSDNWYSIWDTTSLVPQMYVGRIPVNSVSEFNFYLDKHKKYLSDPFDIFNKTYLLISSGDINNPSELQLLKNTNEYIANYIIKPPPTGGLVNHLYKTQNPVSNFGPYSEQQVNQIIGDGGLFISYIGHSGTQIWDNGINRVDQLMNNSGKGSLISDWGCSTGKFAEPDIKAFSELFITDPDGQAIGYTGNSSLGFTSTATTFPQLFYSNLLHDQITSIGQAHELAKTQMLQNYGNTGTYRIFDYCNVLLGDPIINLRIPPKPDLSISTNNYSISDNNVDDSNDSIQIKISYFNLGRVDTANFTIRVKDVLDNNEILNHTYTRPLPSYQDSLILYFPVKNLAGDHKIQIILDEDNKIDELSKSNNSLSFDMVVQSSSIRPLVNSIVNLKSDGTFIFLNPVKLNPADSILVEYADNPDYLNSNLTGKILDTLSTKFQLTHLILNKRYWVRAKLNLNSQKFSGGFSFIYDPSASKDFSFSDSLSFSTIELNNINNYIDYLRLLESDKELKLSTAGFYDGGYSIVSVNGTDYVAASNIGGHHILIFDEKTLNFDYEILLNYWNDPTNYVNDYLAAIDSIPANKIIAIAGGDEPAGGLTTALKNKLRSIGSLYIDSLKFRGSWGIITKKNFTPSHVLEGFRDPYEGPVLLDTLITLQHTEGSAITQNIGPAGKWNNMSLNAQIPANSSILLKAMGIKPDGSVDTLFTNNLSNANTISLSGVDSKIYPYIKLGFNFVSDDTTSLPSINSVDVNYDGVPELGTNYQLVSIDKDSVLEGKSIRLNYS
ncbi:MAG TPA: C25 family cysteine peptidase, partial [Ignavibacteriaceae bacterium]|nr:C25 family cysteine peptidase [Ignavibacteriaceae bacterium]